MVTAHAASASSNVQKDYVMNLPQRVFAKLRREYHKRRLLKAVLPVRSLGPIASGHRDFTALSMVHTRDVDTYLLAIDSFCRHASPRHVVVVCDPSITEKDKQVIRARLPFAELRAAAEFQDPRLPTGGTWERLQAITEYAKSSYVVQVDADTLTLRAVDEVTEAISSRRAFTIGEATGQKVVTLEQARQTVAPWQRPGLHVQGVAEFHLATLGLPWNHYVRGCSGFSGFPPAENYSAMLLTFSQRMQAELGARWVEWGTEQISSNFLIANAQLPMVLPFPVYGTPDVMSDSSKFVHFIGNLRHESAAYTQAARRSVQHAERVFGRGY